MQVLKGRPGIRYMQSNVSLGCGRPKNTNAINAGHLINLRREVEQDSVLTLANPNGEEIRERIILKAFAAIAQNHSLKANMQGLNFVVKHAHKEED